MQDRTPPPSDSAADSDAHPFSVGALVGRGVLRVYVCTMLYLLYTYSTVICAVCTLLCSIYCIMHSKYCTVQHYSNRSTSYSPVRTYVVCTRLWYSTVLLVGYRTCRSLPPSR